MKQDFYKLMRFPIIGEQNKVGAFPKTIVTEKILDAVDSGKRKIFITSPRQTLRTNTMQALLAYKALTEEDFSLLILSTKNYNELNDILPILRYAVNSKANLTNKIRAIKNITEFKTFIDGPQTKYIYIEDFEYNCTDYIYQHIYKTDSIVLAESTFSDTFDERLYNNITKNNKDAVYINLKVKDMNYTDKELKKWCKVLQDEDIFRREILMERKKK